MSRYSQADLFAMNEGTSAAAAEEGGLNAQEFHKHLTKALSGLKSFKGKPAIDHISYGEGKNPGEYTVHHNQSNGEAPFHHQVQDIISKTAHKLGHHEDIDSEDYQHGFKMRTFGPNVKSVRAKGSFPKVKQPHFDFDSHHKYMVASTHPNIDKNKLAAHMVKMHAAGKIKDRADYSDHFYGSYDRFRKKKI